MVESSLPSRLSSGERGQYPADRVNDVRANRASVTSETCPVSGNTYYSGELEALVGKLDAEGTTQSWSARPHQRRAEVPNMASP